MHRKRIKKKEKKRKRTSNDTHSDYGVGRFLYIRVKYLDASLDRLK